MLTFLHSALPQLSSVHQVASRWWAGGYHRTLITLAIRPSQSGKRQKRSLGLICGDFVKSARNRGECRMPCVATVEQNICPRNVTGISGSGERRRRRRLRINVGTAVQHCSHLLMIGRVNVLVDAVSG